MMIVWHYVFKIVMKHFQRAFIHSTSSACIMKYLEDLIQKRRYEKETLIHFACKIMLKKIAIYLKFKF